MKCPFCNKETEIKGTVFLYLEQYGGSAIARTNCCGKKINVRIVYDYKCSKASNQEGDDDWGL